MESGSPSGKEALEVRYAAKDGSGHVRFVGGRSTDGRLWRLSVAALVESIEGGSRFFVATGSETLLLTISRDARGKAILNAGLMGDGILDRLPRMPDSD